MALSIPYLRLNLLAATFKRIFNDMITNLPTSDGLNYTAIKLYFDAWDKVISLMLAFDSYYPSGYFGTLGTDDWIEERAEYVEAAQEDLYATLAVIQQSNELALKARIAAVSSYLLLLNNDMTFASSNADIDFSTLRTLDAVDLPRAVNSLTPTHVSATFIQLYSSLRIRRNQYAHLGSKQFRLNPVDMCKSMIHQYLELWPKRPWLNGRLEVLTLGTSGFFEGKQWSPKQELMFSFDFERAFIPAAAFKKLFGAKKADVKYSCHMCHADWAVSRNGPVPKDSPTANYSAGVMHCILCDSTFQAVASKCAKKGCGGKFAVSDKSAKHVGSCCSCGG